MDFLKKFKISTKVFAGFGIVLLLLAIVSVEGFLSLESADTNFGEYRSLARTTNEAGRVQANLIMTRMNVKSFIISANPDTIKGVHERAKVTLDLIPEMREITDDPDYIKSLNEMESQLQAYVKNFVEVTKKQDRRNELVDGVLNKNGPVMEQKLSEIMRSAYEDGDTAAAYNAGVTLRHLLLARLYVTRFLVENDQASFERVIQEMQVMDESQEVLLASQINPTRRQLAMEVEELHQVYVPAFEGVHKAITERNAIITGELDRIGPLVADQIEDMKLAI